MGPGAAVGLDDLEEVAGGGVVRVGGGEAKGVDIDDDLSGGIAEPLVDGSVGELLGDGPAAEVEGVGCGAAEGVGEGGDGGEALQLLRHQV
ncbi:MAG TPA: hypothetical protein VKA46_00010 [Gemmataceae bacterium]|nr:hypothetical protein [Gemmataceae bacterium]